jgi:hypothetical protein
VQNNLVPEPHNVPFHLSLVQGQRKQNDTDSHVLELLALKCADPLVHFPIQLLSLLEVTSELVCNDTQKLALLPRVAFFMLL